MDVQRKYRVEVRRVGTEKAVVRIDKLNEPESSVVWENLTFPTVKQKGEFEKVIIHDDREQVLRKRELKPGLRRRLSFPYYSPM